MSHHADKQSDEQWVVLVEAASDDSCSPWDFNRIAIIRRLAKGRGVEEMHRYGEDTGSPGKPPMKRSRN